MSPDSQSTPPAPQTQPPLNIVDLSIIIVSWNVWELLRACLASIERESRPASTANPLRHFGPDDQQHSLEVIIVDNASSDATADLIPTLFPWVRLIESGENLGFTRGNNRGYVESGGRYIYFLNPDTELTENALWSLFSVIDVEETVGMIGPQLHYADGVPQNSRRRFPKRLTGFWESTWLGRLWPNNPWAMNMHMLDWPAEIRHDVDWLMGSAMLARREALEDARVQDGKIYTGPFDEGFFMYSEETDLCKRIKEAGWRIVFEPSSLVIHYEGRSSEQVVAARHIHFNTSKVRYYQKHFGVGWAEALRFYLLFEFRWQLWLERVKHALGNKRQMRQERIDVYRQVIDSKLLKH